MKKPTESRSKAEAHPILARLRSAARTVALAGSAAGRDAGAYEAARVRAELSIIADRRTAFDR